MPGRPVISVVVPSRARPHLLARCLDALAQQDLDPTGYEILIVNDGADDATCALVEHRRSETPQNGPVLRYLPVWPARGPAAARNAGWRAARGEIIAFTDDDCVPCEVWLRRGLAAFASPTVAAAAGRVVVPISAGATDYERDAARLAEAEFVTANCFCRRAMLERLCGFDERFTMAWREDSDMQFSVLQQGGVIVRAPDAVVLHPVRPASWGISLRQQRKSQFNALLYKKHPHLYRERIQQHPPWLYYGTVAAAALCVGAALAQGRVNAWSVIGGAGWAALTTAFWRGRNRGTSKHWRDAAEMAVTSVVIPPLSVFWRITGGIRFGVLFF